MGKPINIEVVARRNESSERLIKRFIRECKKKRDLMDEFKNKSPLGKPRFKTKRERAMEKSKKHKREMMRLEKRRKKQQAKRINRR